MPLPRKANHEKKSLQLQSLKPLSQTVDVPASASFKWNDDLEGVALEIASTDHSPLRVLAGPGAGKTRALMRRVARLLQQGVPAERIFLCSFTRTAAKDLKKELAKLKVEGADEVRATTLHSLCFGLLQSSSVLSVTGRTPRSLLKYEERFLVEHLKHCERFGGVNDCKRRIKDFGAAWARYQNENPGWPEDVADRDFQACLIGWLKAHRSMLIGEIIPTTLDYLRHNPLSPYRKAFDYVLADEYQDFNRAEQTLIELLSEEAKIVISGDENQSIYARLKHAHPEGIGEYAQRNPDTQDKSLQTCYRCPTSVVEMANALIRNNSSGVARQMLPSTKKGKGDTWVVQWGDKEKEAEGLAVFIEAQVRTGKYKPGEILVLAPQREIGYPIRDALIRKGVMAHSFFQEEALEGNPNHLEKSQAQQAFTLLTLLADPEDCIALRCWCGFGHAKLREKQWQQLMHHCSTTGMSPRKVLEELAAGTLQVSQTAELTERFRELERKRVELQEMSGTALLDALFPEDAQWAEPLRALVGNIQANDYDAVKLHRTLLTSIIQPELPMDVDYVRVMSLYKSKGLGAKLVIVAGCVQGLVPFIPKGLTPQEEDQNLQEQRRLFYVAITRPTDALLLSSFAGISTDFAHSMQIPFQNANWRRKMADTIASTFLRELGGSCPAAMSGDRLFS